MKQAVVNGTSLSAWESEAVDGETECSGNARQTRHSYEAIHRYISAFKRTLLCKRKAFSPEETANTLGCSARLVKQYLRLIDEFTGEGVVLEELERYDARIAPITRNIQAMNFFPQK